MKLVAHPVSVEFLVSEPKASDSTWLTIEREGGGVLKSDNTTPYNTSLVLLPLGLLDETILLAEGILLDGALPASSVQTQDVHVRCRKWCML